MTSRRILFTAVLAGALVAPAPASGAATFKNCTALRKVYPMGVAKSKKAAGTTGAKVNAAVYAANQKMDRDKDGVACE